MLCCGRGLVRYEGKGYIGLVHWSQGILLLEKNIFQGIPFSISDKHLRLKVRET